MAAPPYPYDAQVGDYLIDHKVRPFFVYLAGGNDSWWRRNIVDRWCDQNVVLIDPFADHPQGSLYQFAHADLSALDDAELVLGLVDYERYTGTALEFGYAHARGVPIVFVSKLPRVDSFMAAVSCAVFSELDEACLYVERRFLQ